MPGGIPSAPETVSSQGPESTQPRATRGKGNKKVTGKKSAEVVHSEKENLQANAVQDKTGSDAP